MFTVYLRELLSRVFDDMRNGSTFDSDQIKRSLRFLISPIFLTTIEVLVITNFLSMEARLMGDEMEDEEKDEIIELIRNNLIPFIERSKKFEEVAAEVMKKTRSEVELYCFLIVIITDTPRTCIEIIAKNVLKIRDAGNISAREMAEFLFRCFEAAPKLTDIIDYIKRKSVRPGKMYLDIWMEDDYNERENIVGKIKRAIDNNETPEKLKEILDSLIRLPPFGFTEKIEAMADAIIQTYETESKREMTPPPAYEASSSEVLSSTLSSSWVDVKAITSLSLEQTEVATVSMVRL